ncbi:uncharacterized protein [Typha angustifolia]|uniref:uncharacterized protein n=1 Tax=Typha angustifolia TaxID=59011 RepID=UPI003C2D4C21
MSFKPVFNTLREVFPQVDLRILKAVAIEHINDVDAAVEFVLFEVIEHIGTSRGASYNIDDADEIKNLSVDVELNEQAASLEHQLLEEADASHISAQTSVEYENSFSNKHINPTQFKSPLVVGACQYSEVCIAGDLNEPGQVAYYGEVSRELNETLPSELKFVENGDDLENGSFRHKQKYLQGEMIAVGPSNIQTISQSSSSSHVEETAGHEDSLEEDIVRSFNGLQGIVADALQADEQCISDLDANGTISIANSSLQNSTLAFNPDLMDCTSIRVKDIYHSYGEPEGKHSQDSAAPTGNEDNNMFEVNDSAAVFPTSQDITSLDVQEVSGYMDRGVEKDKDVNSTTIGYEDQPLRFSVDNNVDSPSFESEMLFSDEHNLPANMTTRSGHFVSIEFLEDFITDAKNNKKNLLSSMELITNMIEEVELHEERAKQAKEEASSAGQDILIRVDELKQMLKHAKEANNMHAGEVFGEKSILATEARELQSRLITLSDERSKSLTVIEEMRQALEARLANAEEEIEASEKEKFEKESFAQEALREQQLMMNAIVEESKKLQQEAEENSRLRDFLMERGRIVDALQGEIAVICEDVMSLKERVDGRLPLSKSLRLSTSSLSSAASSSSYKRKNPSDAVIEPLEPAQIGTITDKNSPKGQQPISISSTGKGVTIDANHRVSSDDEWELFEAEA